MNANTRRWRVGIVVLAVVAAGCGPSGAAAPSPTATPSPKAYATPPGRSGPAMTNDIRTKELVMFGGFAQSGVISDTWAWDGQGWTARKALSDPPITNPSMTYDPANGELLLVGTDASPQQQPQQSSLWVWRDGERGWVQRNVWVTPTCGKSCPPSLDVPFAAGPLTYDTARSRILMVASAATGPGRDTWTWDGAKWIRIATAHRPTLSPALCCLTTDRATGHLLALGYSGSYGGINRLWSFDGTDWTLTSTSVPTGEAMMIDDPATGSPLLVRSTDAAGNPSPETWSWNGSAWQRLDVTSPAFLSGFGLGYDTAAKQVILFGGRNAYGQYVSDTWIWNGHSWHRQP